MNDFARFVLKTRLTIGTKEYDITNYARADRKQQKAIMRVLAPLSRPQHPGEPLADYASRMADHVAEHAPYEILDVMLLPASVPEAQWSGRVVERVRRYAMRQDFRQVQAAARECALSVIAVLLARRAQFDSVTRTGAAFVGGTRAVFALRYGVPTLTLDGEDYTIAAAAHASKTQLHAIRDALQPVGFPHPPLSDESPEDHMQREMKYAIECGAAVPLLAAVLVPVPPDPDQTVASLLGEDFTLPEGWSPEVSARTAATLTTLTDPADIAVLHACTRLALLGVFEASALTVLAMQNATNGTRPPTTH